MSRLTIHLTALFTMFMAVLLFPLTVFAQDANPDTSFFSEIAGYINQFGGMSFMAKIAGAVLLIIAATKTSFLSKYWQALPDILKTLLAPILGLIAGLLSMGTSLTWQSALAYVAAGGGAIILHEILDGVKTIPGIGSIYVTIIDLLESLLGGGQN